MSLADDLAAAAVKPTAPCKTGKWVASLSDEERPLMEQAIDNTVSRNVASLHRVAVRHGCSAGETPFRRHCRRECCCYKRDASEVAA